MMTTAQIIKKYGTPSEKGSYLVSVQLPFPMRISWDKGKKITRIQCHKLIADKFKAALQAVLDHYGYDCIVELGIDLYGGCFNYRKMRGGNDWSRHSWGIAIDLDPESNQLKWGKDKALFAKPEYKPLMDAFYANGFVNLGLEKGYDYMHFEIKE